MSHDDASVHDVVGGKDDRVLHQSALHENTRYFSKGFKVSYCKMFLVSEHVRGMSAGFRSLDPGTTTTEPG